MAVQKSKKTRSRIGMRRSHDKLKNLTLSTDQVSGEKHLRHQMTKDGFYKGRLVKDLRKPVKEDQEHEKEMRSIDCLFPGQGSQHPEMLKPIWLINLL